MRGDVAALLRDAVGAARAEGRRALLEPEVLAILGAAGLRVPVHALVRDARAAQVLDLSGFPGDRVVVKVVSPRILHKSDVGGVRVVPRDPCAVAGTIEAMSARFAGEDVRGCLVVEFVPHDASVAGEVLLGLRWTDDFGPVVTLAPGGVHAERLAESLAPGRRVAVLSPVLRDPQARDRALDETVVTDLLTRSQRGQPPRMARGALVDLLARFLDLAEAAVAAGVGELEANPLVLAAGGPTALDGRALLQGARPVVDPPRPLARIDRLLAPRHLAVLGVSEKMNPGRIILRNVLAQGFPAADVVVVKPGADRIDGCRCVPDLASLPGPVDLLVVAVDARQAVAALEDVARHARAESVILIPGGMGERDGSQSLADRLRGALAASRATPGGGPVVNGANCLGIRSVPGRYNTLFIPDHKLRFPAGPPAPLAMLTQSGAFGVAWASKLGRLNPRYLVTLGNQTDLTVADFLERFADDPEVRVVACYVEGFRPLDGARWLEAAARITASGRRVLLYRAGRTSAGARATASHTASVAGDWTVCRALATQAGVEVVESLADFADLTRLCCVLDGRRVGGLRLGAVSNAGFECVAMADHAGPFTLPPPGDAARRRIEGLLAQARLEGVVGVQNPLDLTPILGDEAFDEAVGAVLDDPGVDLGIVGCVPLSGALRTLAAGPGHGEDVTSEGSVASRLVRRFASGGKAWVVVVDAGTAYDPMARHLESGGVPVFRTADAALRVLARYAGLRLRDRDPGGPA